MTKIVVTGASGTTGFEVVRALREKKADVRAVVHDAGKAAALEKLGAEVVTAEFDDPPSLKRAFEGANRLFMLTPFDPLVVGRVERMLSASREAGIDYVVRMSAAGADRGGDLERMHHHGECETIVKSFGVTWGIVRPTFFMDNLFKYYGQDLEKGEIRSAAKDGKVSYVSCRDIGDCAAVVLLEKERCAEKPFVLTGATAYSDGDIAKLATEIGGRTIRHVDVSPEDRVKEMRARGEPDWFSEEIVAGELVKARGVAAGQSQMVKELLGRDPESLQSFLARNKARLV